MKIGLFSRKITFTTEFPGSNFLLWLPTFSAGGNWDFTVANLLHATFTVKNLKFGTPQTIAIIVLKIEKFDVTLH